MESSLGLCAVEVRDEHILGHVQTMGTQTAVDGMAAMVGCKGDERIVCSPVLTGQGAELVKLRGVGTRAASASSLSGA